MALASDYSSAWRDLAIRRRLMWIAFLGYVPGVALLCFLFARHDEGLCVRIAMAWMLVMGILIARAVAFRCPRCRGLFCFAAANGDNRRTSICSTRCARCGLAMESQEFD